MRDRGALGRRQRRPGDRLADPTQHWLGCQADAKVAALAAQHLELDALGWSRFLYDAHKRFRSPLFRTLVATISRELERVEFLTQSELQQIADPILAAFA